MEDNYTDEYLKKLKEAYHIWLETFKKGLDSQLNQFLLDRIAVAESNIEKNKEEYLQQYKKDIDELKQRKDAQPERSEKIWIHAEELIKKSFERQVQFSQKSWQSFIESCKAKMT